jgi:glycosyltransferase involved in cell wall biosynthesis
MTDLTIAIPFFAHAGYLRAALDSVVAQTSSSWTAIVVDDAGPEPAARDVVGSYDDRRISYVRNERNLGLAGNWNRCLQLAPSELVCLFHADDALAPDYVALVVEAHQRHPDAAAVYTRASVIGPTGRPIFSVPDVVKGVSYRMPRNGDAILEGEDALIGILRGQHIFCPSLSFKKRALGPEPFAEQWRQVLDLDLLARLLFDGHQIVGLRREAYRYRRHASNETARLTHSLERFEEEFSIYSQIGARAAATGWPRAAAVARRHRIIRAHLWYRAALSMLSRDRSTARACVGLLRDFRRRSMLPA